MRIVVFILVAFSFQLAHAADPVFSPALSAAITNSIPDQDWRRLGRNPTSAELREFLAHHHSTRATKSKTLSSATSEALSTVYQTPYFPDSNVELTYQFWGSFLEKDPTIYSNIYTTLGESTAWTKPEYYFDNGSDQNFWVAAISAVRVVLDGAWGNKIPVFYYRICTIVFTFNALIATNPDYNGAIYPPGRVVMTCADLQSLEYDYISYYPDFIYSTPSELPARILTFNPTYPGTPGPVPTPGTSPSPSPSPSISPSPTPSPIPSPSSSPSPTPSPTSHPSPYALSLSSSTSTLVPKNTSGNSSATITARLTSNSNSDSVAGKIITFTNTPIENSGGHLHPLDDRPIGIIFPSSCITGDDGTCSVRYDAPEVGGIEQISASPVGNISMSSQIEMTTKVDGLFEIGNSNFYRLTGLTGLNGFHIKNHFVSSANNFIGLASDFFDTFGATIGINDASLPFGGLFDIGPPNGPFWSNPHKLHREGRSVDIDHCAKSVIDDNPNDTGDCPNNWILVDRIKLKKICLKNDGYMVREETYHCEF